MRCAPHTSAVWPDAQSREVGARGRAEKVLECDDEVEERAVFDGRCGLGHVPSSSEAGMRARRHHVPRVTAVSASTARAIALYDAAGSSWITSAAAIATDDLVGAGARGLRRRAGGAA